MATSETISYRGSMRVPVGTVLVSNDLLALGADIIVYKNKVQGTVSISGTDSFTISFDDTSTILPDETYLFGQDTVIAYGILKKNDSLDATLDTQYIETGDTNIPANVDTPLISISNPAIVGGLTNTKELELETITFTNSNGTKPVRFRLYVNGVSGGTYYIFGGSSVTEVSFDASLSLTPITMGTKTRYLEQVGGTYVEKDGSIRVNLTSGDITIKIKRGETLTVTAISSHTTDVNVSMRWYERELYI